MTRRSSAPQSVAEILAELATCPDCDSAAEFVGTGSQVLEVIVRHDPTCPWFNARQQHPTPKETQ